MRVSDLAEKQLSAVAQLLVRIFSSADILQVSASDDCHAKRSAEAQILQTVLKRMGQA